jgi:tetratricopeptide (TPR) repeat protein
MTVTLGTAQSTSPPHHTRIAVEERSAAGDLLDKAESLLAKGDYASAESLLQQATAKDPSSYQAWYDLGYAHQALKRPDDAIADYKKSVELNPRIFESNLNLGLALAASDHRDEALKYVSAATQLEPANHSAQAKEHAWLALARIEEGSNASDAEKAFLEAARLAPKDPEPHLALGEMYENQGKVDQAKPQFQQALAESDGSERAQALRGLVNVAIASRQYGEAETNVRQYLALAPSDGQAHLLLGRLLAAEGKNADALAELDAAGSASDPAVLREKAQLLVALNRNDEAIAIYKQLIDQNGNDGQLRYQYALALMHQHQYPAAQEQLIAALKLKPNLVGACGDLAVVASENKQYDLALKALDIRTKFLGENPGTYFLRATALDHLRRYPEATQNYRQFLTVANGKFPDQEWQARHRLIAIQNMK